MKIKPLLLILLTFTGWQSATAQSWNPIQKLGSLDQEPADNLGISTAISDSFMLVGAWWEDGDPFFSSAGAAYVYQRQADGSWAEVQKLPSPNPENLGYFGFNVAISDSFMLVGAFNHDVDTFGNAGMAYVYHLGANGQWGLETSLIAGDQHNADLFGHAVALIDGYALIGAYGNDYDENAANYIDGAGAAYIFKREANASWTQIRKLVAYDRSEDANFGKYLDLDKEGLLIGAFRADESNGSLFEVGAAYGIYWNDTMLLTGPDQVQSSDLLRFSPADQDNLEKFGWDVALSGRWAVVGKSNETDQPGGGNGSNTGAAYFFYWENGQWIEKQKVYASDFATNSFFGRAIAIDGSACVIGAGTAATDANGANPINGAGAAYVFELRSNGLWQEVAKLAGTNRNSNDLFGEAVDISGTSIVVGAWRADTLGGVEIIDGGAIYLYERDAALAIEGSQELSGINFFQQSQSQLGLQNTGSLNMPVRIELSSLSGQTLYTEDLQLGTSWSHDFAALAAGVYLLQVQSSNLRPLTWKWIKH